MISRTNVDLKDLREKMKSKCCDALAYIWAHDRDRETGRIVWIIYKCLYCGRDCEIK